MAIETPVVTVFGSSRPLEGDPEYAEAREMGWALASKGLIVCTGGYGGVMEAASRGAKDAGGRTLAVTANFFRSKTNAWVDEEIRVETWEERLFELIRRGDAWVACKGGTGTLVELAVVWEMLNKGVLPHRPFVVFGEFWRPVIDRVREVEVPGRPSSETADATWREAGRRLIHIARTPEDAADHIALQLAGP